MNTKPVPKTAQIFSDTCPYNNVSQTNAIRLLFVCSAGMLRSPTAAAVATRRGHNARSCGTFPDLALIPLSVNLIQWAHQIIFMTEENKDQAFRTFNPVGWWGDIQTKSVVWHIADEYNWGDNVLWGICEGKMKDIGL